MKVLTPEQVYCLQIAGWTIIPSYALGVAHDRVKKLRQAAKRCKMPEPSLEIGEQFMTEKHERDEAGMMDSWMEYSVAVRLVGVAPLLPGGWTMLARVEDVAGARMVFSMPGADDMPAATWCGEQACDHCNKARRRSKTFVLRNAAGDTRRVGATCMRDFLGHDVGLSYCPTLRDLDLDECSGPREREIICTAMTAVTLACAAVRIDGVYVSKAAGGMATSAICALPFIPEPRDSADRREHYKLLKKYTPTDADAEHAAAVLAWLLTMTPTSDFERNIRAIAESGNVVWKSFGLACAIIAAHLRATTKREVVRREVEAEASPVWLTSGRQHLRGELVSCKRYDAFRGDGPDTIKGLIVVRPAPDQVCKVFVTIPGARECIATGGMYEFDANVEPREAGFAIAKRPTNWNKVQ